MHQPDVVEASTGSLGSRQKPEPLNVHLSGWSYDLGQFPLDLVLFQQGLEDGQAVFKVLLHLLGFFLGHARGTMLLVASTPSPGSVPVSGPPLFAPLPARWRGYSWFREALQYIRAICWSVVWMWYTHIPDSSHICPPKWWIGPGSHITWSHHCHSSWLGTRAPCSRYPTR